MTLDVCPSDFGNFPTSSASDLRLLGGGGGGGSVRGANPYFYQSSLCRAAVHAGASGAEGGEIVVRREGALLPGCDPQRRRGGSWGEGMGFRVGRQAAFRPAAQSTLQSMAG